MKSFNKGFLLFLLMSLIASASFAGKKVLKVGVSEPDAKIFVDGKLMGSGQLEVVILSNSCVTIRIEKVGYLTERIKFCNQAAYVPPPKTYYVEMKKDDDYDASDASDIANIDIEIKPNNSEVEAWKLISRIVTSYFDVIEVTDKETGYLCTAWVVKTFNQNTIRTRMIVKQGNSDPLSYKVKLVSEQSGQAKTSVKSDELLRNGTAF